MTGWRQVGDGIFCRRYEFLALTVGAVLGDDGVLVIDTRASHAEARELIADLAGLTRLPVRWVVNTHYHWDHCWGNALFPRAELWGHENTRRRLLEGGGSVRASVLPWFPPERRHEVREVQIVPPDHTVSDMISLDIGRPVDLRYHGRGHTDSDITIEVGDVTFAGDLVEEAAPPSFGDAYPPEWVATLDRVIERTKGPVVPGHGNPVDRAFVERQRADIAATVELAQATYAQGVPPQEVDLRHAPFLAPVARTVVVRTYALLAGEL